MPTEQDATGLSGLGRLLAGDARPVGSGRDLLERWECSGDEAAFAAIVAEHGAGVARVCRSILRHPSDVDDAFQATFLVLARRSGRIRDGERLGAWLLGVARRVALRAKVQAGRRSDREAGSATALASLPDHAGTIDPSRRELGQAVREELGRLPRVEGLAVALCDLDGLSHREAADRLGWPLGTVKTRVARGRDRLRTRLARRGLTPALPWLGTVLAREGLAARLVAQALAGATARAACKLTEGSIAPASLLAPRVWALARRFSRGLVVAPGALAVAVLGVAFTVGVVPRGWADPGDQPAPAPASTTPAQRSPTGAAAPLDGKPDRVVVEGVLPSPRRVEVADMDGDGRPDLVVANPTSIRWLQNPTWVARTITRIDWGLDWDPGRLADFAVLDVNGDGRKEVAVAAYGRTDKPCNRLWLAQPGAEINDDWTVRALPEVPGICQVRAGDLDGDGKPELIAAFRPGGIVANHDYIGRNPKLAGVSMLKLDLVHPQGGILTTAQVSSWLDISAVAIRPAQPVPAEFQFEGAVIVRPNGVKIDRSWPSPLRGEIEVATPNGLWFLQFTPDRFRVQVSSTNIDGPIRMAPAQPYRAVERGRLHSATGWVFAATVAADPHAPLSVWERQESPELPPRVNAEQDPAGAALRAAAILERVRSTWTDLGMITLAPTPLDPNRRGGECVAVADLDGDGTDEIVAGYAGQRHGEPEIEPGEEPGLVIYRHEGKAWVGTVLDATISPRDLRVSDLDGDGRPEVVALGDGITGPVILHPARPSAVGAAPPR